MAALPYRRAVSGPLSAAPAVTGLVCAAGLRAGGRRARAASAAARHAARQDAKVSAPSRRAPCGDDSEDDIGGDGGGEWGGERGDNNDDDDDDDDECDGDGDDDDGGWAPAPPVEASRLPPASAGAARRRGCPGRLVDGMEFMATLLGPERVASHGLRPLALAGSHGGHGGQQANPAQ